MKKYLAIFVINFIFTLSLTAQFKVVQSNPNNYSYDPITKIHKLTDGTNRMQATVIWNDSNYPGFEKIDLNEDFIIEAEMYFGFKDKEGADGIALVLQTQGDNAIGSLGVGMGFAMNPYDRNKRVYPSFGIEIDTWYNYAGSPPPVDRINADHISYVINGDMNNLLGNDEFAKFDYNEKTHKDIEDGKFHCVKYHWDSELEILSVYFDGQLRKSDKLQDGLKMKLSQLLKSDEVWWGFATGTATRDNVHMLIFKKILRGEHAKIVNVNTNTSTLIGEFCEKTISPCDNNIEFSLDETGLQIVDTKWELVPPIYDNVIFSNNNKSIKDIISEDKKYIIEVTYSDGTKAKDSVFAKYLNLEVKIPDTLYLCQNSTSKITGELFVNGELENNNNKILWNWRPKGLFNKVEDNIAFLKSQIPDTTISCDIVYQVSDSVTKCVLSKQVILVNSTLSFELAVDSIPCSNVKTVRVIDMEGSPINLAQIKNILWKLNDKLIDLENHISKDSIIVEDIGILEATIETKSGCIYKINKHIINSSKNNNQKILPNIKTDYCVGDTLILSPDRDFDYYLWNNTIESKDIIITTHGQFHIFAIDSTTGCTFRDTINISFHDFPNFNIANYNVLICNEETKQLDLNTDISNIVRWYDEFGNLLSEEQKLTVSEPSKIYAEIENEFGCKVTTDIFRIKSSNSNIKFKLTSIDGDNEIKFDAVRRNNLYEQKIVVKNLIDSTYFINILEIGTKINYSIPSSQFPIHLTPYDIDTILVVFYTSNFENLNDVIKDDSDCKFELINLKAEILQENIQVIDKCDMIWNLDITKSMKISKPFPNPASEWIRINYNTEDETKISSLFKVTLLDQIGNVLESKPIISSNFIEFDLSNDISVGVYFIKIEYLNKTKLFKFLKMN